jgi:hypothetical protein
MKIFLHVGYPKTGTKALQYNYFPNIKGINYLGKPIKDNKLREIIEIAILKQDEIQFNETIIKQELESVLSKYSNNEIFLLSYEGFIFRRDNNPDRLLVARRLKALFGDAKILIVLRNQFDFIKSIYNQSVKAGMFFSFNKFLDYFLNNNPTFISLLNYYDMIEYYKRLFGKDNVHVFCYEYFLEEPQKYINDISELLGVDNIQFENRYVNKSFSLISLNIKRFLNYFVRYGLGRPPFHTDISRKPGEKVNKKNLIYIYKVITNVLAGKLDNLLNSNSDLKFTLKNREILIKLYSNQNKKICEEYGLNLEKYKYPV